MSFLRLIVAWLVMAALPLQGFAAATMVFCDQAAHSTAKQQPAHEYAGHNHAPHGHGSPGVAAVGHGHDEHAEHAGTEIHVAQAGHHEQAKASTPGDAHACPICASCCNLVALSDPPALSLEEASALPAPLQGPSRVLTREASAPDKPPRA